MGLVGQRGVGRLLWGVRALSHDRGVVGSPLVGLQLVTPPNSLFNPKITFCWGTWFSAGRNLPCPPQDLFRHSPEGTFCVTPLSVSTGAWHFPVPAWHPPGTAPGTETRPVPRARPGPAALLRLDTLLLDKTISCRCFRGAAAPAVRAPAVSEERGGGDPAHPTHPKSGFLTPFVTPFVTPFPGAASLLIFPGPEERH